MTDYYKKYLKYKKKYLNKKKIYMGGSVLPAVPIVTTAAVQYVATWENEIMHTLKTGDNSILGANDITTMNSFLNKVYNQFNGKWAKLTGKKLEKFIAQMFRKWIYDLYAQLKKEKKNKTITGLNPVNMQKWKDNVDQLANLTRLEGSVQKMLKQHNQAKEYHGITHIFNEFINSNNKERCEGKFRKIYWEPFEAYEQCFAMFSDQTKQVLKSNTGHKFNHQDLVDMLTNQINKNTPKGTRPEAAWPGAYCYICGCQFVKKDVGGKFSSPECEHILPFADALWYFGIAKSADHGQDVYETLAAEYAYAHKVCNGLAKQAYKVIRYDINKNKYIPHYDNFEKIAEIIWDNICAGGTDADHFVACFQDYVQKKPVPQGVKGQGKGLNHPVPDTLLQGPYVHPASNCDAQDVGECPKAFKDRIKENMSKKVDYVLRYINEAYNKVDTKFTQIPGELRLQIYNSWGCLKTFANICSAGMADIIIGPEYIDKSLAPVVSDPTSSFHPRCHDGGGDRKKRDLGLMLDEVNVADDEVEEEEAARRRILIRRAMEEQTYTPQTYTPQRYGPDSPEFKAYRKGEEKRLEAIYKYKTWVHDDSAVDADARWREGEPNKLYVNFRLVARQIALNLFQFIHPGIDFHEKVVQEMLVSNAGDIDIILTAYFKMKTIYATHFYDPDYRVKSKEDSERVLSLFIEQIKLEYISRNDLLKLDDDDKPIKNNDHKGVYERLIGPEGQLSFEEFILNEMIGFENKHTLRDRKAYTVNVSAHTNPNDPDRVFVGHEIDRTEIYNQQYLEEIIRAPYIKSQADYWKYLYRLLETMTPQERASLRQPAATQLPLRLLKTMTPQHHEYFTRYPPSIQLTFLGEIKDLEGIKDRPAGTTAKEDAEKDAALAALTALNASDGPEKYAALSPYFLKGIKYMPDGPEKEEALAAQAGLLAPDGPEKNAELAEFKAAAPAAAPYFLEGIKIIPDGPVKKAALAAQAALKAPDGLERDAALAVFKTVELVAQAALLAPKGPGKYEALAALSALLPINRPLEQGSTVCTIMNNVTSAMSGVVGPITGVGEMMGKMMGNVAPTALVEATQGGKLSQEIKTDDKNELENKKI